MAHERLISEWKAGVEGIYNGLRCKHNLSRYTIVNKQLNKPGTLHALNRPVRRGRYRNKQRGIQKMTQIRKYAAAVAIAAAVGASSASATIIMTFSQQGG